MSIGWHNKRDTWNFHGLIFPLGEHLMYLLHIVCANALPDTIFDPQI